MNRSNAAKARCNDLAILGGQPAFDAPLHVGRPNIGDRSDLHARIESVLDSRWLTNDGGQVKEFEARMVGLTGAKHCIATCNATAALEITARALGMAGEVIVPSMTFVATAHALQWMGLTPVFVDVDPQTHNIDPLAVESAITSRTSGVVGVHLWGRPCDIDALTEIGRCHDLRLLFDAAHAIGCSHNGQPIGSFGNAEVFSFHATKVVNSFEGGAITTSDDHLAEKIRLMRNFGFAGMDNVVHLGTNAKMHEVSAAMGNVSLSSLDRFVAANRKNYEAYREFFSRLPGLSLLGFDQSETNNYQYIVCEIDESVTGLSRDLLLEVLHAENIRARRYFWPGCHRMEPYRSMPEYSAIQLPITDAVVARVLVLPSGTAIDEDIIATICDILRFAIEHADTIRSAMHEHGITI